MSSPSDQGDSVAKYFHEHAADFDSIYDEQQKSPVRRLRDRLSRGTVVQRLEFVEQRAREWKPATALDVGTGGGRFAVALARQGITVVGLDFAADMLEIARQHAAAAGVAERCTFLPHDIMQWDPPEKFELTLGIGLLDYIGDADAMLGRLVAATSGRIIASFPKLVHPLVPLRYARLRSEGCPVWFYRRSQVAALGAKHLPDHEIIDFHRDYLLVGRTA